MKIPYKLLLTGIIMLAMGAFFEFGIVYMTMRTRKIAAGAIIAAVVGLLFLAAAVMMIAESIKRMRRLARIKKNGKRYIGRVISHQKKVTNEIDLLVRYVDERGAARQAVVSTEREKEAEYPIGADVVFFKLHDDAALAGKSENQLTKEKPERLENRSGKTEAEAASKTAEKIKAIKNFVSIYYSPEFGVLFAQSAPVTGDIISTIGTVSALKKHELSPESLGKAALEHLYAAEHAAPLEKQNKTRYWQLTGIKTWDEFLQSFSSVILSRSKQGFLIRQTEKDFELGGYGKPTDPDKAPVELSADVTSERLGEILLSLLQRSFAAEHPSDCEFDLIDITDIIAPEDEAVRQVMEEVMADPVAFYNSGPYDLSERSLDDAEGNEDAIKWLSMVDALLEREYAIELDWKEELNTFAAFVPRLKGMKRLSLTVDEKIMDAEQSVPDWCGILDAQWKERGCCMACIDIDSDSYVLFPCTEGELERLSEIAASMNHKIGRLAAPNAADGNTAKNTDTSNNTRPTGGTPDSDGIIHSSSFELPQETIQAILKRIAEETRCEMIRIRLDLDREPGLFDSKVGGIPYWDLNLEYPHSSDGSPLALLAQFNLSELPENKDLPGSGMLQFFILPDDLYGLDFDSPDVQDGFRVVYHPEIDRGLRVEQVTALGIVSSLDLADDVCLPVTGGEFALSFSTEKVSMDQHDYRFDGLFQRTAREMGVVLPERFALFRAMGKDAYCAFMEKTSGHHLLGYPYFTQTDPRAEDSEYDTLLFQLDSDFPLSNVENRKKGCDLMWGDSGVGGFFINRERLRAGQFDRVLYNWDCG